MITVGSIDRETAAQKFAFLAARYPGRRSAIKEFTHTCPEFVFWIYPDGRLYDARQSHRSHVPRGSEWIVRDEPDYGGFLRGRIARLADKQLVVVYCRPEALAFPGEKVVQFVKGMKQSPVAVEKETLVISDNGDLYGTYADLMHRSLQS